MTEIGLEKIEKKVLDLPVKIKTIIVTDDATLKRANNALVYIKDVRKEISDFCDPNIKRLHEAHREALSQKRKFEEPLVEAEMYIKPQISSYVAELERKRREAEEKARKEEEERRRLEEEKLQAALNAENAGKKEEAEKIINEAIPEEKPAIPIPGVPKLTGIGIRKIWKWKTINESLVPREFLVVDSAKITDQVRVTKGQAEIPGIEIYSENSVAARSSK